MITLTLEEEGHFRAHGKLKSLLSSNSEFTEIIQQIIDLYQNLGQAYVNYMAGDNKLIGQEKANLKKRISNMLNSLIQVRIYLEKAYFQKNIVQSDNFSEGFNFTFHIEDYEYTITGEMSASEFNNIKNFEQWYFTNFKEKLSAFINDFKVALKDKALSKEEVSWLNKRLNSMIHSQLIMYYKLEHSPISK